MNKQSRCLISRAATIVPINYQGVNVAGFDASYEIIERRNFFLIERFHHVTPVTME
jgi:hypothetical protein